MRRVPAGRHALTRLTDPLVLAGRTAPSRVLFGPHETNLARGRALSARHVAHYARRAAGGCGVVVTETASVHVSDHPYELSPLAADCGPGWADVVAACRPYGALVLASLGHTGAQGTSAHAGTALWAPSAVPDVVTREVPVAMEQPDVDALVAGFAAGTRVAVAADVDGVEVDAGPRSLLRQFLSGLTNARTDGYGADRARLLREVLAAVRAPLGPRRVLALRLACDEQAPWAGITPDLAVGYAAALAPLVDLLVVVRGGGLAPSAYRPDGHVPPGFNTDLTRAVRAAAGGTPVVLQGSVVDVAAAQRALDDGVADAVEMTRAQLADADLVVEARAGVPVRPCTLCNQACQVRDVRNPPVSCVADPSHDGDLPDGTGRRVTVVGGGPAGLEAARVLASAGAAVRLVECADRLGGALHAVAALPGRARFADLAGWLAGEVSRLGVRVELGTAADGGDVVATGARRRPGVTAADVLAGAGLPPGPVVVWDPVGGPVGVGVAELLAAAGREVVLVTPDAVAGERLGGDLGPANARLARAGVRRETSSLLRSAADGVAVLADRWTGTERSVPCAVVVDAGPLLPGEVPPGGSAAGDAVAPRTVLEAVLEGRRAARAVLTRGATDLAAP
ncbi:mycofactocin system FadH/OYE family oxidoreductase 1 [Geodermatophilus sp. DSM 44513]|uniref:mycofactocin system FadH/OYE family oxidoreductase 1 n=1 Tax=Geodermatophilus sp. DSM 44513 TaxID=1528104 RepID=UPI0028F6D8FB|nr:mycofactocin system FadH/OYE family oxidoreductase 1 [Geodermatophilus sp. DSM 44513]WNV75497.1 mycofactocin system FadH/OYE family oxidoreductase 1 [Geodermatophilus sp. DSM 44513]